MNSFPFKIILGSQSPRRSSLLKQLGISFTIKKKDVDESYPENIKREEVAEYLSRKKATAFLGELKENEVLITCDTVVILEDKILGKASNVKEAKSMLQSLSGKQHQVVSGVCISNIHHAHSFSVSTEVYFKTLKNDEIDFYIEKFQPFDKAGAYGIQEWIGMIGVEKIIGSYYNVMGLPVKELFEELNTFKS